MSRPCGRFKRAGPPTTCLLMTINGDHLQSGGSGNGTANNGCKRIHINTRHSNWPWHLIERPLGISLKQTQPARPPVWLLAPAQAQSLHLFVAPKIRPPRARLAKLARAQSDETPPIRLARILGAPNKLGWPASRSFAHSSQSRERESLERQAHLLAQTLILN